MTPTTLGTTANATGSSMTHSTSANAPAGSKVLVFATGIAASGAAPALTLAGGPGGWTKRKEVSSASLSSGFGGVATIWDLDLAAQMNASTVLTFTSSVGLFGLGMAAVYETGMGAFDTGVVDGRAKTTGSTTFDTQATTAPNTSVPSTLVVACAIIDSSTSITITAPPVEMFDFTNPNAWCHAVAYEIKSAIGAARIQGTWAASAPDISALAAYQYAAGAAAVGYAAPALPKKLGPRAKGPLFFAPLRVAPPPAAPPVISTRKRRPFFGMGR